MALHRVGSIVHIRTHAWPSFHLSKCFTSFLSKQQSSEVMEAMAGSRIYTEVDPPCQWVEGEEFDTLLVDASGFKKQELKAQVDTSGNLKISGECHIEGNQWRRFLKSFQLPKDCNVRMIKAKFDEGILYVVVPKPMAEDRLSQGVANNNVQVPETSRPGMEDVVKGLNKYRQFIVNVVVGIIVVVGIGTYIGYKLRSHI